MDARKKEIRNLECQLCYREATPEEIQAGQLGTITGRAIVFNAESEVLDDDGLRFREVIAPEAATKEWLDTQDIKINLLHQRELTFGRSKRGVSGNARLWVDEAGVNFEVSVPNCDLGIRARELTKAKVYDGCSFEFWPDEYDIEERNGMALVRHTKFKAITALTLGMDPAYLQTTLSARELLRGAEKADSDDVKKELKAADEAAEQEEDLEELKAKSEDPEPEEPKQAECGDKKFAEDVQPDDKPDEKEEEDENPNKMERELARRQRNLRRVSNIMRNIFY